MTQTREICVRFKDTVMFLKIPLGMSKELVAAEAARRVSALPDNPGSYVVEEVSG